MTEQTTKIFDFNTEESSDERLRRIAREFLDRPENQRKRPVPVLTPGQIALHGGLTLAFKKRERE